MAEKGKPWTKAGIVLNPRQLTFLKKADKHVRKTLGVPLNTSGVIRALLNTLEVSGVDLAKAPGETALESLLAEKWLGRKAKKS